MSAPEEPSSFEELAKILGELEPENPKASQQVEDALREQGEQK